MAQGPSNLTHLIDEIIYLEIKEDPNSLPAQLRKELRDRS